jgi:mRNA-degrading endonuclease RelE of RelBE toxin-antitoxin system
MSLHFGGYRILYLLDRLKQTVTICFIDKHDKA